MIKYIITLLVLSSVSLHAQLITNFGTNAGSSGTWVYNSGTSTLSGTEGLGDTLAGVPTVVNYTGASFISLTANVTTAPNNNFTFILLDGEGDSVEAIFDWASFIGGATVQSALSTNGLFNSANVIDWNLVGGGSGTTINATLTSASGVIPEPSTYALLGLGLGALFFVRRRYSKVA